MLKRFSDPKITMLANVQVLRGASRAQLRALCAQTTQVDFPAGVALCTQGRSGAEMFFIVEGTLSIERDGEAVATLGPGEIVGELSMITRKPRTATVRALTPVSALVLGRREFETIAAIYDLASERIDVTGVKRARQLANV